MSDLAATEVAPEAAASPAVFTQPEIRSIVIGLLLAIFLSAIDSTIVAVSLLTISRELGGVSLLSWVISAYLVASTVAAPIYGKLSDLYGRKRMLSISIWITVVGSILCALAQSMPQLVLFRVIQGLGGGGLMALSQAVIADVAPGRERGRYQGYFSGTFAVAAVVGPILGGYLTHYLSWRAVFWVNLPIAAAALWLSHRSLSRLEVPGRRHEIDYPGAVLLIAGLACLLIALTRIGQGVDWTDPSTPGLLVAAVGLLTLCGWWELRAREPIVPPAMLANRTAQIAFSMQALIFFVIFSCSVLLPLAIQSIEHASADQVALRMLPLTVGIPIGSFSGGRLIMNKGSFRRVMVCGSALAALSMTVLAFLSPEQHLAMAVAMGLLGLGLGLPMPVSLVAMQMSVAPSQLGIATATAAFFRTLGGAIGIALLTSVLMVRMRAATTPGVSLQSILGGGATDTTQLLHAFRGSFLLAALACLIALALSNRIRVPESNAAAH